jgi:RNA polymerase sigma factor (sigma-70 family)
MENMLAAVDSQEDSETALVTRAKQGSPSALADLLVRHQPWIYNIALRMVGRADDAEDVMQEVYRKVIAGLPDFRGESSFKTWLYRIVSNHVINMGKRPRELVFSSFESRSRIIDEAPDLDLEDHTTSQEAELLVRETKVQCMMGTLLCLDRPQRLAFIAALLGAGSAVGSAMLDTTMENYRQTLSRARRQLSDFMNEKCSLIRAGNSCRCEKKTRAAIAAGYVDPAHLLFVAGHVRKVKDIAVRYVDQMDDLLDMQVQDLFREHPFLEAQDCIKFLDRVPSTNR